MVNPRIRGTQVAPSSVRHHLGRSTLAAIPSRRDPEPSANRATHASGDRRSECEINPEEIHRITRDDAGQRPKFTCVAPRDFSAASRKMVLKTSQPRNRGSMRVRRRRENDAESIPGNHPTVKPRNLHCQENRVFPRDSGCWRTKKATSAAWAKPLPSTQFIRPDGPIPLMELRVA